MLRYRPSCVGRKLASSRSTIFRPCACRSRSRMTFGFSNETVYAATELRNPGWNSSVTAAPPTTWRRSSTVTFNPPAARYAAQTRPLWPPPTIRTSLFAGIGRLGLRLPVAEQKFQCSGQSPGPRALGVLRAWFVNVAEVAVVVAGCFEIRRDGREEPLHQSLPLAARHLRAAERHEHFPRHRHERRSVADQLPHADPDRRALDQSVAERLRPRQQRVERGNPTIG